MKEHKIEKSSRAEEAVFSSVRTPLYRVRNEVVEYEWSVCTTRIYYSAQFPFFLFISLATRTFFPRSQRVEASFSPKTFLHQDVTLPGTFTWHRPETRPPPPHILYTPYDPDHIPSTYTRLAFFLLSSFFFILFLYPEPLRPSPGQFFPSSNIFHSHRDSCVHSQLLQHN